MDLIVTPRVDVAVVAEPSPPRRGRRDRPRLDGDLGRWRKADLDELLLELYPRKVVADGELAELTVPAVAGLLEFLDEEGLLVPGSDPLPRLLARLDALRGPFLDALGDASRYGLGKSLFGAMMGDGVDLDDEAAVGGWVEAFNAGPREERDQVLGPAMVQMSAASQGRRRLRPRGPVGSCPACSAAPPRRRRACDG